MSISDAQDKVAAFHRKFGVSAPGAPQLPQTMKSVYQRERWIADELEELHEAQFFDDDNEALASIADAYIDIIYFALGGLVELGIDAGPLFDAVHEANMRKIKLPGVAKIAKPEGWTAPDIAALIEAQRKR